MKKLTITKIDGYNYYLSDEEKQYILNMEFYGIDDIEMGDVIYIHEKHIKDKQFLSFGPLNGIYGKEIKQENKEEIIVVEKKDSKIYLKRFYG